MTADDRIALDYFDSQTVRAFTVREILDAVEQGESAQRWLDAELAWCDEKGKPPRSTLVAGLQRAGAEYPPERAEAAERRLVELTADATEPRTGLVPGALVLRFDETDNYAAVVTWARTQMHQGNRDTARAVMEALASAGVDGPAGAAAAVRPVERLAARRWRYTCLTCGHSTEVRTTDAEDDIRRRAKDMACNHTNETTGLRCDRVGLFPERADGPAARLG